MIEYKIECSLERFFISTACIMFSDEKEKFMGQLGVEWGGQFREDFLLLDGGKLMTRM